VPAAPTEGRRTQGEVDVREPSRTDGATAVEYALMVGFIAAVVVGSVAIFGTAVLGLFAPLVNGF